MKITSLRLLLSAAAALTGGMLLVSGPAFAAGPTCTDGKIVVGAVSTITGPADFSEVPKAAKATFDKLNADGGINGCKIE